MPSAILIEDMSSGGKHIVVIIADEIVNRLGINDDSTYVQKEVIDDGILLRVKHFVEINRKVMKVMKIGSRRQIAGVLHISVGADMRR